MLLVRGKNRSLNSRNPFRHVLGKGAPAKAASSRDSFDLGLIV